ncbi:alpha/beta fold hydrolase [Phyllobacterium lublinensis]|uniref:alpha/beta fold hydrolase n=1 Tax=Phyllobacterium lublinensis TaxID=2875708 RepID=UPI001CCD2A6B|nr:alpha/beta hydrolase [Phyllobacterium sp. 2063]MBZ9653645.1 alpha/beta hydrolase [Phyllobacterium sp. 2063]
MSIPDMAVSSEEDRMYRNLGLIFCVLMAFASTSSSAIASDHQAKTVVLVHGAFADGSSWQKVIPLLHDAGLKVIAVQNPLESLESDVAFTTRAIRDAEGPVVLVGHSWGGVVITEAGGDPKVKSLVYVAAYAPDAGQSLVDVASKYPDQESRTTYVKDEDGYLKISHDGISRYFAAGLSPDEQRLVAVVQGRFHVRGTTTPVGHPAWRDKPSFMVVATEDQIIAPQLQRDQVKTTNAEMVEVSSGHVAMLSHPKEVAELIVKAAQ